jgi:hypothetical protein
MNKSLNILAATLVVGALTACGGGGGSAGTSPFANGGVAAGCAAASAASGSGGSSCVTASALTLTLDSASIQNTGAATVKATATATTASGQALSGIPISFSVDNGATFTQSSTSTSSDGTSIATVAVGADPSNRLITVTATSGALTATRTFAVTGSTLTATGSAVVAPGSSANQVIFRLTNANGAGIANQPITIVAGALGTTVAATDVNGNYTYTYTAPGSAGSLDIVGSAGGVSKTLTVLVQSGAGSIVPAVGPINSASVSANPSVVSTNSASTDNRTEIRALFVGPGNATIPRVRVRFDLNGDPNNIGGTFSTGTSVIYSDDSGLATTAYIPGAKASPTNGVTIRACYDVNDFAAGTCPNQATTTITVVSDPLSVTIGSNDKVVVPAADLTYIRKFVILVVDSSGQAKANVDIAASIDLERYWKGFYTTPGGWISFRNAGGCINEDINRNGVLEAAEDINRSAAIEPRKSDVAVSILGTGKTDASGLATLQIEYPQNIATWARVKILVSATGISGTEGRATWTEDLPAPVTAFQQVGTPPFAKSPYGVAYFAMDPTTFMPSTPPLPVGGLGYFADFPKTTFPDGTAIPSANIADPCRNPF